jgi:putative addiction module component (TIGR02574 family)
MADGVSTRSCWSGKDWFVLFSREPVARQSLALPKRRRAYGDRFALDSQAEHPKFFRMGLTADKMRTELASLTEAERADLARFLIQSLDSGSDKDAEAAWDAELERRADEIKNGQESGESADKVFSELRAKHS